jgi:hypothetical protein
MMAYYRYIVIWLRRNKRYSILFYSILFYFAIESEPFRNRAVTLYFCTLDCGVQK